MNRCMQFLIALLLALSAGLPQRASAQYSPELLEVEGWGSVQSPQFDGTFIVWIQMHWDAPSETSTFDIVGANINDPQPFIIAKNSSSEIKGLTLAIDQGVVVWSDGREVFGKELASGRTFSIADGFADEYSPAISGKRVVWLEDDRHGEITVKARDISSMSRPVTLASLPQGWTSTYQQDRHRPELQIDGERVVWEEWTQQEPWSWRLRTTRIGGSEVETVAERSGRDPEADFDLHGDMLVYAHHGEYPFRGDALFALNLRTGERIPLDYAWNINPVTDGRYVFWEDTHLSGRPSVGIQLRGYDLQTRVGFTVFGHGLSERQSLWFGHGRLLWTVDYFNKSHLYAAPLRSVLPTGPVPAQELPLGITYEPLYKQYFSETGHSLDQATHPYWEHNGGLGVFGMPLTETIVETTFDTGDTFVVQYLERQRFELHGENEAPYDVLLGRLGDEILRAQGRDWQSFPKASPDTPHYFPETGHAIALEFWDYWRSHGLDMGDAAVSQRESLALFGLPLSEAAMEVNSSGDRVLTQWFERARFEYHPNNPDPYKVLLGRLGAEVLQLRGWTSTD